MKLVLLAVSLFTTPAFAFDLLDAEQLPTLSQITLSKSETGMTAAQPQGFVNFSYGSCAKMSFDAVTEEINNITYIKVELQSQFDCMGSTIIREYSVQFLINFAYNLCTFLHIT